MIKILIGGFPEQTANYQAALAGVGLEYDAALTPADISRYGGLLLPGGGDIDPVFFGQPVQGSRQIDHMLDQQQLTLLDRFLRAKKPVLGICKGMQLINVYFGGTIIQHLPTAAAHQYDGQDQVHLTWSASGSVLEKLYGRRFSTNSAHHQGLGRIGRGLRVIQETADYVPEGIIHTHLPLLGVQWHPERMCLSLRRADTADGLVLFQYFKTLVLQHQQ